MTTISELRGADVIGVPGQNLTRQELAVLVGLADGHPSQAIAERIGCDAFTMRQIEAGIQAKLGARNKIHMIARGFLTGVLLPNALCLLLCIVSVFSVDGERLRTRTRRGGGGVVAARLLRPSTSNAGRGGGGGKRAA